MLHPDFMETSRLADLLMPLYNDGFLGDLRILTWTRKDQDLAEKVLQTWETKLADFLLETNNFEISYCKQKQTSNVKKDKEFLQCFYDAMAKLLEMYNSKIR